MECKLSSILTFHCACRPSCQSFQMFPHLTSNGYVPSDLVFGQYNFAKAEVNRKSNVEVLEPLQVTASRSVCPDNGGNDSN